MAVSGIVVRGRVRFIEMAENRLKWTLTRTIVSLLSHVVYVSCRAAVVGIRRSRPNEWIYRWTPKANIKPKSCTKMAHEQESWLSFEVDCPFRAGFP